MSQPPRLAHHARGISLWATLLLILALFGCEYIDSALPPSPSPFPTMARLPSVTPVTPSRTPLPTPTLRPEPTITATPSFPLEGTVAVGANIRAGPGTSFEIVTSIIAGTTVSIQGRNEAWYRIETPDGIDGWMSAQVLEVAPQVATAIPAIEPSRVD